MPGDESSSKNTDTLHSMVQDPPHNPSKPSLEDEIARLVEETQKLDKTPEREQPLSSDDPQDQPSRYSGKAMIYRIDAFDRAGLEPDEVVRYVLAELPETAADKYLPFKHKTVDGKILVGKYDWGERGNKSENQQRARKHADQMVQTYLKKEFLRACRRDGATAIAYAIKKKNYMPSDKGGRLRKGQTNYRVMLSYEFYLLKDKK